MTHHTDRSRFEIGNLCMRRLYWNYYHGGLGIVPVGEGPDLSFGKAVHAVVEGVSAEPHMAELEAADRTTPDGYPVGLEWGALFTGLAETYKRYTLPVILEEFEWVSSEQEMEIDLGSGITWMTRLDGVIRRKKDDRFFVLEAKTSSYPETLLKQSSTNFQLLMEVEALRRKLPKSADVGGAMLLVFNKGSKRWVSKKEKEDGKEGYRRWSPFTYWYGRELEGGSLKEYRLNYAAGGYERTPIWEIPDWYQIATSEWLDVVKSQVQFWPSVEFDADRVKHVMRQIVGRETFLKLSRTHIEHGEEMMMDFAFPQNFARCDDTFGGTCPFKEACFSPRIHRAPLESGLYEVRQPNHPTELKKPEIDPYDTRPLLKPVSRIYAPYEFKEKP